MQYAHAGMMLGHRLWRQSNTSQQKLNVSFFSGYSIKLYTVAQRFIRWKYLHDN